MEIGFEQHQAPTDPKERAKYAHNVVLFVAVHFSPHNKWELRLGTLSTDGSNCSDARNRE